MAMHKTSCLLTVALVCGFAAAAPATTIFEENFDYDAAHLNGQSGGTGFAGNWFANLNHTSLTSNGLSYQVQDGETLPGGSGALQIGTGEGEANFTTVISRSLATGFTGDEIFVRFLIRQTGGSVDVADRLGLWVGDTATSAGYAAWLPLGGENDDFFIRPSAGAGASTASGGADVALNETFLVIARFAKSTAGADEDFDIAQLWVNPASGDAGSPDASASGTSTLSVSSLAKVGIQTIDLDADDIFVLDNLKAGTTWEDVVPVPEPGSMSLLALGALLTAGRRRRK